MFFWKFTCKNCHQLHLSLLHCSKIIILFPQGQNKSAQVANQFDEDVLQNVKKMTTC